MIGYKSWAIPEGNVVQVTDESGTVIWALDEGFDGTFKVKKITSNTYAGETTYTGEQFILLDIYPKPNGTVSVTYGGLTKTITDTSGSEKPNAQQVFFGKFNGVSDSVETPASGVLTISGACRAFGCGSFDTDSKTEKRYNGVTAIGDIRATGVTEIADYAFAECSAIERITIPNSITEIGYNPFYGISGKNILTIDGDSEIIKVDGNCLMVYVDGGLVDGVYWAVTSGFADTIIPSYAKRIVHSAFRNNEELTNITIPSNITDIWDHAFYGCTNLQTVTLLSTTPPSFDAFGSDHFPSQCTFVVPKGSAETYKADSSWSTYASRIVEAL